MNLSDFEFFTRNVPRLQTKRHAQAVFGLVRWLQPESVVEVGSWQGYMSLWIARALQENDKGVLTCIDDFSLLDISPETLGDNLYAGGVSGRVTIACGPSYDLSLWPSHVDLAFIDGDHSFEGCHADVERAIRRGAECVIVHDVHNWWGPREWLEKFREFHSDTHLWDVISVGFDSGLAIALKRPTFGEVEFSREAYPEGRI